MKKVKSGLINFKIVFTFIITLLFSCDNEKDTFIWPELLETGELIQITTTNASSWDFHSRWSNDGSKVAFARFNSTNSDLSLNIWDKSSNEIKTIVSGLWGDCAPTWNPEDTKMAIDVRDENDVSQIYIVNINDGQLEKLTTTSSNKFRPCWSKDGSKIVFTSSANLYTMPAEESSGMTIPNTQHATNAQWNFDDSQILFVKDSQNDDIYIVNNDGTELTLVAEGKSGTNENWASWSPDGTKIIYQLYHKGIPRLIMKDLKLDKEYLLLDKDDCRFADWSPDGNSIVFAHDENLWLLSLN